MSYSSIKTAVLFLVFNRLDTTKRVFHKIQDAKPPRLYIASDGPRARYPDEDEKVKAVRDYVVDSINWDCEVKALFRKENLGCKNAVNSAIDWFFSSEEMGIILEDDCLPSRSFFFFCEELLERFKDDERVFMIGGRNHLGLWKENTCSYFFTTGAIWGWASWRRAWAYQDLALSKFSPKQKIPEELRWLFEISPGKTRKVLKDCKKVHSGQVDTWDYSWCFNRLINQGIGITPSRNLVVNIGIGENATNTKFLASDELALYELDFPLIHNNTLQIDSHYLDVVIKQRSRGRFIRLLKRVKCKLLSLIEL